MAEGYLPYGCHDVDEEDIAAVVNVLRHGVLTGGPKISEFEKSFANKVMAKEAVVVSNGTAALHLALLAAGISAGDTVIVPSVTFLSSANAVLMTGADVHFADVCPETGLMTPKTLRQALSTAKAPVKCVLPVHLTGQMCDMVSIKQIAEQHTLKIVTDCCHALGASYAEGGHPGDGGYEDFGCFSLHPVKSIAMGEGGVITTSSSASAERMRLLRGHDMHRTPESFLHSEAAFDKKGAVNPWYYEMHELAYNYRATDMQCALGISQLTKLDAFIERRQALATIYDALLSGSNGITPNQRTPWSNSAWHLYAVSIDFKALGVGRGDVMRELLDQNIGSQVHYIPVHEQPFYKQRYGAQKLPGAQAYYEKTLSLPLFPAMTNDDPQRVITALQKVLNL